MAMNYKAIKR